MVGADVVASYRHQAVSNHHAGSAVSIIWNTDFKRIPSKPESYMVTVLNSLAAPKVDITRGLRLLLRSDAVASLLTNDSAAFKWKLHCHWLIGLWQSHIVVVMRVPVTTNYVDENKLCSGETERTVTHWFSCYLRDCFLRELWLDVGWDRAWRSELCRHRRPGAQKYNRRENKGMRTSNWCAAVNMTLIKTTHCSQSQRVPLQQRSGFCPGWSNHEMWSSNNCDNVYDSWILLMYCKKIWHLLHALGDVSHWLRRQGR